MKNLLKKFAKKALLFLVHYGMKKAESEAISRFTADGLPGLQKMSDKLQENVCKRVRALGDRLSFFHDPAEAFCGVVMEEGDALEKRAIGWAREHGPDGIRTAFDAARVCIDAKISQL